MMRKSPSGALSPYYYKGGYFHGIHYGDYHDDATGLYEMMAKEEEFIKSTNEQRRIMMDLYQTDLSDEVLEHLKEHIIHLQSHIIKLAFATNHKDLKKLRKVLTETDLMKNGQLLFTEDMEEGKTWLVGKN